jgi:hypothetical protein
VAQVSSSEDRRALMQPEPIRRRLCERQSFFCSIIVRRTAIERLQIFDAQSRLPSSEAFIITVCIRGYFRNTAAWHEA